MEFGYLYIPTDSETLSNMPNKPTMTFELRLMIDVAHQAFDRNEATTNSWIRCRENRADAMTKHDENTALLNVLRINKLE